MWRYKVSKKSRVLELIEENKKIPDLQVEVDRCSKPGYHLTTSAGTVICRISKRMFEELKGESIPSHFINIGKYKLKSNV